MVNFAARSIVSGEGKCWMHAKCDWIIKWPDEKLLLLFIINFWLMYFMAAADWLSDGYVSTNWLNGREQHTALASRQQCAGDGELFTFFDCRSFPRFNDSSFASGKLKHLAEVERDGCRQKWNWTGCGLHFLYGFYRRFFEPRCVAQPFMKLNDFCLYKKINAIAPPEKGPFALHLV